MNGRDPAFLPYTLYSITAYTGAIVGPPAPAEFAEVLRRDQAFYADAIRSAGIPLMDPTRP